MDANENNTPCYALRVAKGQKVLQYTATHCNTLQRTTTHCNTLQHTATHEDAEDIVSCRSLLQIILQCVAVCCGVLQCIVVYCRRRVLQVPFHRPYCSVWQRVAVCCSVWHCVADAVSCCRRYRGRRYIGCLKLQVSFRKRDTRYRSLLRKTICEDKASFVSSPPYIIVAHL